MLCAADNNDHIMCHIICAKGFLDSNFRIKGCRMGRSDEVSLWYVSLLINTRFRFFILELFSPFNVTFRQRASK